MRRLREKAHRPDVGISPRQRQEEKERQGFKLLLLEALADPEVKAMVGAVVQQAIELQLQQALAVAEAKAKPQKAREK